jgi:iron-sulfur cluster repair protein YtfE (RIC family)
MYMAAEHAVRDRVAYIIATHHDHVWGRLPFLGPMAARVERERGSPPGSRLGSLIAALHDLLFAHLDREDRVLLAIASDVHAPDLADRAVRLHAEHGIVRDLLDQIRAEVGGDFRPVSDAGPTERVLRAELGDLDDHLREQIELEEQVIEARSARASG